MTSGLGVGSPGQPDRPPLREGDPLTADASYRLLSDNPNDVIYRTGPDRRAVWISANVADASGWTVDELIGTVIEELVHPDDWAASNATREALRTGAVVPAAARGAEAPMRLRMKSGEYRWMSIIGVPYLDEDGNPAGIVGRIRDVDDMVRARELAEADELQLRSTIAALLDPLVVLVPVHDEHGALVDLTVDDVNPAACDYVGLTADQLVGSSLLALLPGLREEGQLAGFDHVLTTGETLVLDDIPYRMEFKGDQTRYYDVRVAASGTKLVYIFRDQTERRRAEHALAEREELYRLVTEDVTDAVVRYGDDGVVTWVSPSFEHLTGYPAEAVVGHDAIGIVAPEDREVSIELRRRRVAGDEQAPSRHLRVVRADGTTRWIASDTRPFVHADGSRDGFVTVLRDIDEQVQAEQLAEHRIGHDRLTGLANRELASVRIDRALAELGSGHHEVGLLCIGVDRLTTVNQALSYSAGDIVLTTIATRIATAVGDPDRVARVAGDEFVVLLPDLSSATEAAPTADRLLAAAHGTITIDGRGIEPTVSIGIASGNRSSSGEDLLRQASLASRQAKDAGRDQWRFVDQGLAVEARLRLSVEAELRDVLRDGQVTPWFQPVVTLVDRRLRGYEALARWTRRDGSIVQPDQFLHVAETTGLVVEVDLAVLSDSLDLLAVSDIEHVAVNVSSPSLASTDYLDAVTTMVTASGVDPARLRLEVTETALLGSNPVIAEAMREMAARGATWYVDDFGTGYSSISHLRDLPVGGLKLDKSFTSGIRVGDPTCVQLAQGLIGLATGLGLDTVAEGVETEFEAGTLLGQGWRHGQGWLFGRPGPLPTAPA
jgi:diguanylate cyclase (GGDEF)-like protein/PAS domain S-box-containing protein